MYYSTTSTTFVNYTATEFRSVLPVASFRIMMHIAFVAIVATRSSIVMLDPESKLQSITTRWLQGGTPELSLHECGACVRKKKQKLEFEQKLQRKMHAIQRMQQEYARMQAHLNPVVEGVQAEIDNLKTLKDLSVETQSCAADMAAANPGIVEAIAATDLPSMSSSGSDSSNNSLV